MSRLLLMLCWLPLTVTVPGAPPAPQKLRMKSHNLTHVLQWERGAGTSPEVSYSVSFHTDRGPCCSLVPGCEQVLEPLLCDLSQALSDPEETYHLQVTAQQHSERTSTSAEPFLPIRDTELEPPVLQVALCNSSLCVDMDSPVPLLHSLYMSFWYELKVESSSSLQPTVKSVRSLSRQQIPGVTEGLEYCVSIRFADPILPRQSSFGPAQCVPYSSTSTGSVLLLLLVPGLLLLLLVVSAGCYTLSVHHTKPALPSVLTSVLHSEEKLEVSCHPAVSSLLLIQAAPPEEHPEYCSSETEDSEGEGDSVEAGGSVHSAPYTSKASLCSLQHANTASHSSLHMDDEVDLLTLTFSRDTEKETTAPSLSEVDLLTLKSSQVDLLSLKSCRDTEKQTSAPGLSHEDLPLGELMEETAEDQEDYEDECSGTGYMSRP